MYLDILDSNQQELLPLVKQFSKSYYLVGGTAIALQIGHRRSIDFDLFTTNSVNKLRIKAAFQPHWTIQRVIWEDFNQLHLMVNDVKMTFYSYPFSIKANVDFQNVIKMPTLLELAAMKALALGGRAKWKDYVDLYFLFKNYCTLTDVSAKAKQIFEGSFNPKLFREQLTYYKDVDYSEEVEYMPGFEVTDEQIKAFLTEIALKGFV